MAVELVALCDIEVTLSDLIQVGAGPSGDRLIVEVAEASATGDRLRGRLRGRAAADWLSINGGVGTLDVRATIETEDGAVIYMQYGGRTDVTNGMGSAPIYMAPRFETSDERYRWLNTVQAVGKGTLEGNVLHYEVYEVR